MCSNSCECDTIVEDLKTSTIRESKSHRSCRRCGSEPFIILDKVHVECRQCFLESCSKKFRSTIGKSKLVKNNEPVLIAYSGGPSSCALLDLIHNSVQSCHLRREQKLKPSILHIDMQSVFQPDAPNEVRCSKLLALLDHLAGAYPGWPIYWSTIDASFGGMPENEVIFSRYKPNVGIDNKHTLLNIPDSRARLQDLLTKLSDLTEMQQFVTDLTSQFIDDLATAISKSVSADGSNEPFRYVFGASSMDRLATGLLVDVILGRGATICSAVSICNRRACTPVMRPMREFSQKEVALYLRARNIDAKIEPNNLLTFQHAKSCIQTATENFLGRLYVDYPSTYSTLLRTGNRMQD